MNMKVPISPYVNITRLSMKHLRLGRTQTNLKRYFTSIILRPNMIHTDLCRDKKTSEYMGVAEDVTGV